MNGLLASQAVTGALALLTSFTGNFLLPPHLIYDGLEHTLRPNAFTPEGLCPHYPLAEAGWRYVLQVKHPS